MSVNFGYGGYGMMNGMNGIGMNAGGNTSFQSASSQYDCHMCYQYGAVPYNYACYVNPLPRHATNPSIINRIINKIFGV